ncbi:MAG TPA: carboxypeptidase-like regulatory domain-containing protein, partial [Gemmatales bacterium]|nr:carboxypeptidase-like regulatory domain-containing protein [Gemmatales bacterium]
MFLYQNGLPLLASYADSDGLYRIDLDATGTFDLLAVTENASFTPVSGLVVTAGSSTEINFVAGTATLTVNLSAPNGMDGIDVEILHVLGSSELLVTRHSLSLAGGFTVPHLTPGVYRIRATSGNQQGLDETFNVGVGGLTLTRTLGDMGQVNGVVRGGDGQPLMDARVILTNAAGVTRTARTLFAGQYQVAALPAGTYTITVIADGHLAEHGSVTVGTSLETRDFDLTGHAGTVLTGRFVDAEGRPVVGVNVLITQADGTVLGFVRSGTQGNFTVSSAQGANLTLAAIGVGYGPVEVTGLNVAAGANVDLGDFNLVLTGRGSNPPIGPAPGPLLPGSASDDRTLSVPFSFGGASFPLVRVPPQLAQRYKPPANPAAAWIASIQEDLAFDGIVQEPTFAELEAVIAALPPKCRAKVEHLATLARKKIELLNELKKDLAEAKSAVSKALGDFTLAAGKDFLVAAGTLAAMSAFMLELVEVLAGGQVTVGAIALTGKGNVVAASEALVGMVNDFNNLFTQMEIATKAHSRQGLTNPLDGLPNLLLSSVNLFAGPSKAVFGSAGSGFKVIDQAMHGLDWINLYNTIIDGALKNLQFLETKETAGAVDIAHKHLQNVIRNYKAVVILARNAMNDLRLAAQNCNEETPDPLLPPRFDSVSIVGAFDPNEKLGAGGHGTPRFVTPGALLPYTIYFENTPEFATAAAQEVVIEDQLDPDADWSTFEFGDVGFGGLIISVPAGLQEYQVRVSYQNVDGSPLFVDVEMRLDRATGRVRWVFRSVDPVTGTLPSGAQDGFLPVNDETGRGEHFELATGASVG